MSGRTYVNVDFDRCLSERNKYYPKLIQLATEETKLDDEVRRYEFNTLMAKLDEIDLPTVAKRKVRVIINPKTRKTQLPSRELARQKLKIFRQTLPNLPTCVEKMEKLGVTYGN